MTKHTPGPWIVNADDPAEILMDDIASIHCLVATVHADGCEPEQWGADARLIAAAPEMLAALRLALEYWAHRQQRYKNRHPAWVNEARAAIAKAEGGANG